MRFFLRSLPVFLAAAAIGFLLVAWQLPNFIMGTLMSRVADMGGVNKAFAPPLPDEKSRTVVLPSPDLAYVLCAYDLSAGPLTVSFNPPQLPYWSVAAYADNTDNFVVFNDRTMPVGGKLVLRPAGSPAPTETATTRNVNSPSRRGIVLFRGLMPNRDPALLKQVQDSISCQALDGK